METRYVKWSDLIILSLILAAASFTLFVFINAMHRQYERGFEDGKTQQYNDYIMRSKYDLL